MTSENSRKTVLVVDGNCFARQLLSDLLSKLGYQPIVTENSEEAMIVINNIKVDIAFVNCYLPGSSGKDLYKQLRERRSGLPIVMMSGLPREDVLSPDEEISIPFLTKPISLSVLRTALLILSPPSQ